MTKVTAAITMSLDGFITGPNDGPGRGLGDGGERLHYWVSADRGPTAMAPEASRPEPSSPGVGRTIDPEDVMRDATSGRPS